MCCSCLREVSPLPHRKAPGRSHSLESPLLLHLVSLSPTRLLLPQLQWPFVIPQLSRFSAFCLESISPKCEQGSLPHSLEVSAQTVPYLRGLPSLTVSHEITLQAHHQSPSPSLLCFCAAHGISSYITCPSLLVPVILTAPSRWRRRNFVLMAAALPEPRKAHAIAVPHYILAGAVIKQEHREYSREGGRGTPILPSLGKGVPRIMLQRTPLPYSLCDEALIGLNQLFSR